MIKPPTTGIDREASSTDLPPHLEQTVREIARMHAEHLRESSPIELAIDRATAMLGSAYFLGALILFVLLWVGINAILPLAGGTAYDHPPYPWLVGSLELMALFMTSLILITQRRADRLASRRDQLTLEFALVGEQKTAKIIELLEELRRDSPHVRDRIDEEAKAMATPADTRAVHDAIADAHDMMAAKDRDSRADSSK